jgi:septal ring factor EnvC (AmiA/AmiB activator)
VQNSTAEREGTNGYPFGSWPSEQFIAPTPSPRQRRLVPRTALIIALAVAIAFATTTAVALVFDRNISRTLHTTQASLATSNADLAGTRSTLAGTRAQLARTAASLAGQQARVRVLTSQVTNLESELSSSQSSLHASQQVGVQVAAVAGSLKRCVDDTNLFESGFTAELSSGYISPVVTNEATQADASCAQANAAYNTLESELSISGATTT